MRDEVPSAPHLSSPGGGGRVTLSGHSDCAQNEETHELGRLHHLRSHWCGGHRRQEPATSRDRRADRHLGHRCRQGGSCSGAHPRARPRDRGGLWRHRPVCPGGRAHSRERRGHGGCNRTTRPCTHGDARDLHARLRHDELRLGWRLHHGEHPQRPRQHGQAGPGSGSAARIGGVRLRPPRVRPRDDRQGPARRPGDDPAVHGHCIRCPPTIRARSWRW